MIAHGRGYDVGVYKQPTGQTCVVSSNSGITKQEISSINVDCTRNQYALGGSVTGLLRPGLRLVDDRGNSVTVSESSSSHSFQFPKLSYGKSYTLSIQSHPTGQTCEFWNGSHTGTMPERDYFVQGMISCTKNRYSIGGSISGLSADGLVLKNNGGNLLNVQSSQTNFTFSDTIFYGDQYSVSVSKQPIGQKCEVSDNSGQVTQHITTININCTNIQYAVAIKLSEVALDGLVLQNNGGDDLAINKDQTSARFAQKMTYGQSYAISIKAQPPGMNCSLEGSGSGTINESNIGALNIVDAATIRCEKIQYQVSGNITDLSADGLRLQYNGGGGLETVNLNSGDSSFVLPVRPFYNTSYSFSIISQPTGQVCTITNPAGTVTGNVNIQVTCVTNQYTVSGTITGLTKNGLILRNVSNSEEITIVSTSTAFTFANKPAHGAQYNITIAQQPTGQLCEFESSSVTSGTATGDIAISVTCRGAYKIIANITGLTSSGLSVDVTKRPTVLGTGENTSISITAGSSTQELLQIASGTYYSVNITAQPNTPDQTCFIIKGQGRIDASDITVNIECVNGALNTGTIRLFSPIWNVNNDGLVLSLNSKDFLPIYPNEGSKNFSMKLRVGETYTVAVNTQPNGQTCRLLDHSGTVAADNNNVRVSCQDNYGISGSIEGLMGSGLILKLESQELSINQTDTQFEFQQKIAGDSDYNIVVKEQPTGQNCIVINASKIIDSNVTNVTVKCTALPISYSIPQIETAQVLSQTNKGKYPSYLLEGRAATVRAFVYAKIGKATNPSVQLSTSSDNGTSWNASIPMTCPNPLTIDDNPTEVISFNKGDSCYADIPEDQVTSSLMLKIEVGNDHAFFNVPLVTSSKVLNIHLVPVAIDGNSSTLPFDDNIKDAILYKMPFTKINISRHATPVAVTSPITARTLLEQVTVIRTADNSSDFYYAMFPSGSFGITAGMAWINNCLKPFCTAFHYALIGTDDADDIAIAGGVPTNISSIARPVWSMALRHELGHNLSLFHAPCVVTQNTDPNYPYAGGVLPSTIPLYDQLNGALYNPAGMSDTMGYCSNTAWWFSDYNYYNMQKYIRFVDNIDNTKFSDPSASPYEVLRVNSAALKVKSANPVIMISGSILDTAVTLKPVQSAIGLNITPSQGPYTLHVLTTSGKHFKHQFDVVQVDHYTTETPPLYFQLVMADPGSIQEIYVSKHETRLRGGLNAMAPAARLSSQETTTVDLQIKGTARIVENNVQATITWDSIDYPYLNLVFVDSAGKRSGVAINATGGQLEVPIMNLPVGGHWEISISDGLKRVLIEQAR